MKSRARSSIRKKANRVKKANKSDQGRTKSKDAVLADEENLTLRSRKRNESNVIVSESESEESVQERSKRKNQRLNVSVAETDSDEDYVELIDMFDESVKGDSSDSEDTDGEVSSCTRKSPRNSPRKRQATYSTDDSDTEFFDAFENISREIAGTSNGKDEGSRSTRSTDDEEEAGHVDKTHLYYLKTLLVPLEDIGGLLQSYLDEQLTKDWTFSIRRSKTSKRNRPSSSSGSFSSQSDVSSTSDSSDPNDDDFSLSESSLSDSEESSNSGSNFSWESECESISSSNSSLPRKRHISSSEEDSDSKSEELEEIEDDFVLHTKKKKKELRKRQYGLRRINSAIRSKVAKYCNELTEESIDSSDE